MNNRQLTEPLIADNVSVSAHIIIGEFKKLDLYYEESEDLRVWRRGNNAKQSFISLLRRHSLPARVMAFNTLLRETANKPTNYTDYVKSFFEI